MQLKCNLNHADELFPIWIDCRNFSLTLVLDQSAHRPPSHCMPSKSDADVAESHKHAMVSTHLAAVSQGRACETRAVARQWSL
jgi:hypothetical protein